MRTTLDIDDDVLQAAKELASREKKTAGQMLSDLARNGLVNRSRPARALGDRDVVFEDGWFVLQSTGGIVTKELVDRLIHETDLEEGALSLRK